MLHEEITKDIIGAGMVVLNELKPGLDEKLYEKALVIELLARGHMVESQKEFAVHYRGKLIGKLIPDLIVDDKVIADPKVVTAFNDSHFAQMLGYLNITGLHVALLLDFKLIDVEASCQRTVAILRRSGLHVHNCLRAPLIPSAIIRVHPRNPRSRNIVQLQRSCSKTLELL